MKRTYLIDLREEHGETQAEIASMLGISTQYYSLIEQYSRKKRLDVIMADQLAQHFGVPITYIVTQEEELFRKKS